MNISPCFSSARAVGVAIANGASVLCILVVVILRRRRPPPPTVLGCTSHSAAQVPTTNCLLTPAMPGLSLRPRSILPSHFMASRPRRHKIHQRGSQVTSGGGRVKAGIRWLGPMFLRTVCQLYNKEVCGSKQGLSVAWSDGTVCVFICCKTGSRNTQASRCVVSGE